MIQWKILGKKRGRRMGEGEDYGLSSKPSPHSGKGMLRLPVAISGASAWVEAYLQNQY